MKPKASEMVVQLQAIGAIKRGRFQLKSGQISPLYVDLRTLIGYPALLRKMAELLFSLTEGLSFDLLCGVPYSALPMATVISTEHDMPMCIKRKEKKSYGTAKSIEGVYEQGDRVLIIEDVVTSGSSIVETAQELREAGLEVSDAVVFLDRGQNSRERLREVGIELRAAATLAELFDILGIDMSEQLS